jgi:hypothetical protein
MFDAKAQAIVTPKNLQCREERHLQDNRDSGSRIINVLGRRFATALIAICGAGTVLFGASTVTHAAPCNGSNNLSGPLGLGPNGWGAPTSSGAASVATSLTTAITTLDIAFLTQTSAFVGTPNNPQPDQLGGGVWIRGVGGQNTVSSTGTAAPGLNTTVDNAGGSCTANSQGRMDFGGFQAGIDLGRFNLGATGLNIIFGVTGGLLDARDQEQISPGGTFTFTVPFVGGYAAATKGNFFADVLVREDFYQIDTTATSVGLSNAGLRGNAINVMGEAGYRYDLGGSYFVEPSIGLIWSHLNLGTLSTPGVPFTGISQVGGDFTFNSIDSLIGRAGVRVGTSFNAGNLGLQPFVAASVWDEFAGDTTSSFVCNCQLLGGVPTGVNISSTRVGTFGQFGLGTAAQILNTGWLGFVRADYRTGENIQGWDLTGGIRYQFAIFSPPPPLVSKN